MLHQPVSLSFSLWLVLILLSLSAEATTYTVTNLNDSGGGSLRSAIRDANATAGDDIIIFQNGLSGTINLGTDGVLIIKHDLTINGPGADQLTISANRSSQIFLVKSGVTASINGLTLKEGFVENYETINGGGAIGNYGVLTLNNCVLSDNSVTSRGSETSPGGGGAIFNAGVLKITNSTLSDNNKNYRVFSPYSGGGGINNLGTLTVINSTFFGNSAYAGGGILNWAGQTTVLNSTLFDNLAAYAGGGMYSYEKGTLIVINSTLSDNRAANGGGISGFRSQMTVNNSTLSGNSAVGGGIYNDQGILTLGNSLIVGNTPPTSTSQSDEIKVEQGSLNSQGHNLFGKKGDSGVVGAKLAPSDLVLKGSINTAISQLDDNGGPTKTHYLVSSSPAIDAGDGNLIPTGVTTDQRGFARIQGAAVDIGAVEADPSSILRVTASKTLPLTVVKIGNGTVTSDPAGIDCGVGCDQYEVDFARKTVVKLVATPASDSNFIGWSGDCSGTSICTVKMTKKAKSVTATFTPSTPPNNGAKHTLIVAKGGNLKEFFVVTSTPAGISCEADCEQAQADFAVNTSVTLTVTKLPNAPQNFYGDWTGNWSTRSNENLCTVTMTDTKSVNMIRSQDSLIIPY